MLSDLGAVLPMALGIAISPVPIIASLLLLMAASARKASIGFAIGWVLGVVVSVTVFTLLSALLPPPSDRGQGALAGLVRLLLGAGLLVLAWRQWQSRPAPGEDAALPKWMSALDSMTSARALGLAFLLAALNPKNLMLAAAAGLVIGQGSHSVGVTVVFVVLASSTVAGMVLARLVAGDRLDAPLQSLRGWLVQNNAAVMAVLLLILGTVVLGKGLAAW